MTLKFEAVDQALEAALPELQPCIRRLVAEWDNFDGERPGSYLVFDVYQVWIRITAEFAHRDPDAQELARRAFDFAEEMLTSDDPQVRYLAIDSCTETLNSVPRSRELVEEIGGSALRRWVAEFGRPQAGSEIIDLWGVREVLAACLPQVQLRDLPGITQPAEHHRLPSLADAHASDQGVVMLYAFGKSGMFVLARSSAVRCGESTLHELASELAPASHPNDADVLTRGKPGVAYFEIPPGERVWNMSFGSDRHARLNADIDFWSSPNLADRHAVIRARIGSP